MAFLPATLKKSFFNVKKNIILASIAALYMAMLVGLSVVVNKFQSVLNAFNVLVIIMLQGIIQYYICLMNSAQHSY